jgi:hypothetical protein
MQWRGGSTSGLSLLESSRPFRARHPEPEKTLDRCTWRSCRHQNYTLCTTIPTAISSRAGEGFVHACYDGSGYGSGYPGELVILAQTIRMTCAFDLAQPKGSCVFSSGKSAKSRSRLSSFSTPCATHNAATRAS